MENTFKDAYFGKSYKTRDGRKAIYLFVRNMYEENKNYFSKDDIWHILIIEGKHSYTPYYANGSVIGLSDDCEDDIVSEWEEEINEGELDELAEESLKEQIQIAKHYESLGQCYGFSYESGFKEGYRKAKEE